MAVDRGTGEVGREFCNKGPSPTCELEMHLDLELRVDMRVGLKKFLKFYGRHLYTIPPTGSARESQVN